MFEIVQGYLAEFTYGGIFLLLLMCGLGFPLPEDIPILISGYLSHLGVIELWPALAVNLGGVLIGDLTIYFLGYWLGRRALSHPLLRPVITPARLKRVEDFFERHGKKAVFFGRFLAGFRAPTFLVAGIIRMPVRLFVLLDVGAAFLTVPLFFFAAYIFGDEIDALRHAIGTTQRAILLLLAAGVVSTLMVRTLRRRRERGA
ncbi:MAG: DedA family protein [bacterium]